MQVLWSRAAQARSTCRCSSCLHATTSLARRSTTATSRRGVKVGDIFTAFYSTILATAALADSRAKGDRAKEWDRAIAEARDGKPLHEIQAPGFAGKSDGTEKEMKTGSSLMFTNSILDELQAEKDPTRITYVRSWNSSKADLEYRFGNLISQLKNEPKIPSKDNSRYSFVEEKDDPYLPPREPRSQNELLNLGNCVAVLVQKLLSRLSSYSAVQQTLNVSNTETENQFRDVMIRFNTLTTNFNQLPIYSYQNIQTVNQQRSEFLQALNSIFKKANSTPQSIDLLLAKICYNLLVSTTPPSTKTYNLLLTEFSRLRRHDIAQDVLDTFYESKLRPNRITFELIVRHYTVTKNRNGLRRVNQMLRGLDSETLVNISSNKSSRSLPIVQSWAADPKNKVISWGGKLISRPPRDKNIFNSLIRGQLELKGARSAVRVLRLAIREKQPIKSTTLVKTIWCCLAQADFTAAVHLLLAILSPWITSAHELPSLPISFDKRVRRAIYRLLWFIGVDPSQGSSGYLIQPLKSRSKFHVEQFKLPCHAMNQMLHYMRLVSMSELSKSLGEVTAVLSLFLEELKGYHEPENYRATPIPYSAFDKILGYLDRSKGLISLTIAKPPTPTLQTGDLMQLKVLEMSLAEREKRTQDVDSELRHFESLENHDAKIGNSITYAPVLRAGRMVRLKGLESSLAGREKQIECINLELELIEAVNANEFKIEAISHRLSLLEGSSIAEKRLEHLKHLSWVFSRQLMALSLQFGWMDIDREFHWRSPIDARAWKRRLLANYDKRLCSTSEDYSKYHLKQLIAAGKEVEHLQIGFPAKPWLINPSHTTSWRSVDLTLVDEPLIKDVGNSPVLAIAPGLELQEENFIPGLDSIPWPELESHRSSYIPAFG